MVGCHSWASLFNSKAKLQPVGTIGGEGWLSERLLAARKVQVWNLGSESWGDSSLRNINEDLSRGPPQPTMVCSRVMGRLKTNRPGTKKLGSLKVNVPLIRSSLKILSQGFSNQVISPWLRKLWDNIFRGHCTHGTFYFMD